MPIYQYSSSIFCRGSPLSLHPAFRGRFIPQVPTATAPAYVLLFDSRKGIGSLQRILAYATTVVLLWLPWLERQGGEEEGGKRAHFISHTGQVVLFLLLQLLAIREVKVWWTLTTACVACPHRLRQVLRTLYNNESLSTFSATDTYGNDTTSRIICSVYWTQWRSLVK